MHTFLSHEGRLHPAAVAVFALLGATLEVFAATGEPEDQERQDMESTLRVLWSGGAADRLQAAESAYFQFAPLFNAQPGDDGRDAARTIESLLAILRNEPDDFITYRLLGSLGEREDEVLTPLFLEALKSPSPNLRWAAVRWFAERASKEALPELEYLFRHEERPWVRARLMVALVRNGSRDHADALLAAARGRDATLAAWAIRALTLIGDPEVVPFLARTVRSSRTDAGLTALDALTRWPGSTDAAEAVLDATRSPHVEFQRHAAEALGSFDTPEAAARAYLLASGRGDPYVRAAALRSLGSMKSIAPDVLQALALSVLEEPRGDETAPPQSAATSALMELDDPSALPELRAIAARIDDPSFELTWLITRLSRPRDEAPEPAQAAAEPSVPPDFDIDVEEESSQGLVILPPPTMLTVRCRERPGIAGNPKGFKRLPAGTAAAVKDRFETGDESWVLIEENECWVPLRFVESPGAPDTSMETKKETPMFVRREFDLPAEEVESDVAQGLMDAGLLEVIEAGDEVIGVAISVEPEDFDRVLLLARSCGLNETMLDGEIYEIVADLAPFYRGHPAFDRFRRAPQVRPGETDERIDLHLKVLSDD